MRRYNAVGVFNSATGSALLEFTFMVLIFAVIFRGIVLLERLSALDHNMHTLMLASILAADQIESNDTVGPHIEIKVTRQVHFLGVRRRDITVTQDFTKAHSYEAAVVAPPEQSDLLIKGSLRLLGFFGGLKAITGAIDRLPSLPARASTEAP